jgi:hypothetical protein
MIDFISADNAMIQMFDGDNMVAEASTAKSICYFIQEYGLAESVFASSSVDFASEYGFEDDDAAIELWEAGVKKFEMAGV